MTTSQPSNASELQLYNVLKRANLLQYYDTFIAQGGDDVQQLCEAGEEEFLEIMALVGMAAKPLHVRRLQKALQEWVANPAALEANAGYPMVPLCGPAPGSISAVVRDTVGLQQQVLPTPTPNPNPNPNATNPTTATNPNNPTNASTTAAAAAAVPPPPPAPAAPTSVVSAPTWTPQPGPQAPRSRTPQPPVSSSSRSLSPSDGVPSPASTSALGEGKEEGSSSPLLQPLLMEAQVQAIAMAAANIAKQLPFFQPKDLNSKKPVNREIQSLVSSAETTPNRIEELRKYAAIYGRFDSKRKNDRPMSLHEISVNEAAAQLCLHCPALLTRREDLFPLARQVVRDSGYQYSKGHSRAAEVVVTAKKGRLDPIFQRHFDTNFKNIKQELDKDSQEERLSTVAQELASIRQHQEQVKAELQLAKEENDIPQTHKLQSELASLTSQQLQVLQEHSDLLKRPWSRHSRSKQNNGEDQSRGEGSDSSSPLLDMDQLNSLASATFDSLYSTIRNSKGTLFEEGLRIAQQYGLADFARELQILQSQRQTPDSGDHSGGENGNLGGEGSVTQVLEQPFELKEIKPGFDSGIGDDSLDGDAVSVATTMVPEAVGHGVVPTTTVENGVQTVEVSALISSPSSKGDNKPDLKRKGDSLESLPTRPPSRRSRSNPGGGLV
ncbi:NAB transcription cofactor mab-10-like isoform X2 [Babylonia areolata]